MQVRLIGRQGARHFAVRATGALAASLAVALLIACGSSSETGSPGGGGAAAGTSGVSGTAVAGGLSAADKQKLCDWAASLLDGYGAGKQCSEGDDAGTYHGTKWKIEDQKECVEESIGPKCTATVSEVEACTRAAVGRDPCGSDGKPDPAACDRLESAGCDFP